MRFRSDGLGSRVLGVKDVKGDFGQWI
jgi:hypothetical protein